MAAPLKTSKDAWVGAALQALAAGGIDAVKVEALGKQLGATKGSFYHHFADRQALLDAMLASWEQAFVDRAIELADEGGGDGRTRLRRLFTAASTVDALHQIELSMRDWARRDPEVAATVARVDERRLAYLRPLFAEFCDDAADVEGRCLLVLTLLVGDARLRAGRPVGRSRVAGAAALRHLLR